MIAKHALFASLVLAATASAHGQADGSFKWEFYTAGPVVASPAVGPDGTIYVGSQSKRLIAINPDGSKKWLFPDGLLVETDWFEASPALSADGGTIYAGNYDGNLYAIDAATGEEKWRYSTGAYILSSAAVAEDGTVYFGAGDGALHAVNPDGTEKWEFPTGDWVDSSPAIGADGTIYFGSWDAFVYAVNPDGSLKWKYQTGGAVLASPAIGPDGTVYIGSTDGKLYAIRSDGTLAWTFAALDSIEGGAAVAANGNIIFGSADGFLYALKADGSEAWPEPYDAGQGIYSGVALRADGTILFGASDNRVHALNADGTLKWRFAAGFIVDSTPTPGPDGTIYFGSYDRMVYALNGNGSGLAETSWPKHRADVFNTGRVMVSAMAQPPSIETQPLSQTVDFGEPVSFSVEAGGTLPLSFQWFKDGVAIPGATEAALTIPEAVAEDAGSYTVQVSNSAGAVFSEAAMLTVNPPLPPVITVQPQPLTVGLGARVSLWVTAEGSEPLLYQWKRDGVDIPGATGRFYEVDAATAGDAGLYTVVVSNAGGVVESLPAEVSIAPAANAVLTNLSTRGFVGAGESGLLIPGFVASGTGGQRLLIRAVGPGLAEYKVSGYVPDPILTVFNGGSAFLSNDNWGDAPNADEIAAAADTAGAFELDPAGLDAAALVEVAPGGFTAQVSGVDGATGVCLVEIYHAGGEGRLINLSTRADTGPGDAVLTAGFGIEGDTAKTLLVRVVGPSLERFGVAGFVADPVLKLFDAQNVERLVVDDWGEAPDFDALVEATQAVGAFDLDVNSADAAALIVLSPGSYTVQAVGATDESGNVLVEVYEVP